MDPRDLAEGIGEHVRHVLVLKVDPEGGELVPDTGEPDPGRSLALLPVRLVPGPMPAVVPPDWSPVRLTLAGAWAAALLAVLGVGGLLVGSVRLSDSSGEVDIDGVERDVKVDVDSSGELNVENVKGNVTIDQDSSGDISVVDVGGDVRIESDSSGGVYVKRVGGAFSLGSKSSGDIQVAEIKGTVTVPPGR